LNGVMEMEPMHFFMQNGNKIVCRFVIWKSKLELQVQKKRI
jgi:hypothetical protein